MTTSLQVEQEGRLIVFLVLIRYISVGNLDICQFRTSYMAEIGSVTYLIAGGNTHDMTV